MRALLAAALVLLAACDEGSFADNPPMPARDATAPPPPTVTPSQPAPQPTATATATANEPRVALELLKLQLTSDVQKKEPVDKLEAAVPGKRVYAHVTIRNRSKEPRKISLTYVVNGNPRSPVDLEIEPSWSYRTWGYNTLPAGEKGELEVRVTDDAGAVLGTATLPIRAK
jgi:hypothetical protein